MKNFFKPEDFEPIRNSGSRENIYTLAADIANEKLNKLIESWPKLYEKQDGRWWLLPGPLDTRTAFLACIEEIKKEPCKHEPILGMFDFTGWLYGTCKHCGVELQATWSEKK